MASLDLGRLLLGACVFTAACGSSSADGDGSGGGSSNPTADDGTTTTDQTLPTGPGSNSQGTAEGTMGSADTTVGTTMGSADDDPTVTGPGPDVPDMPGCGGIDFLFVIDDSGSMAAHQASLLASFPGFIDAIQTSLEGITDNYHVGVITSDDYAFNEPGCQSLGDLVTQTGGDDALGQVCTPFAEGNRYATEQDDLAVAFPCMAQVGTDGSFIELPVTGAIAALDAAHNGAGACNDGFLRDDAVLVVV
ncbi:MAG: hypothetical protein KDK70_41730, partial [Myxococcales bacterium]|nr:hypothetical protein [Myxococcales bacterium]